MFGNSGLNISLNHMKESRSVQLIGIKSNKGNLSDQSKFDEMFLTAVEKYKEKLFSDAYEQFTQEINLIIGKYGYFFTI